MTRSCSSYQILNEYTLHNSGIPPTVEGSSRILAWKSIKPLGTLTPFDSLGYKIGGALDIDGRIHVYILKAINTKEGLVHDRILLLSLLDLLNDSHNFLEIGKSKGSNEDVSNVLEGSH